MKIQVTSQHVKYNDNDFVQRCTVCYDPAVREYVSILSENEDAPSVYYACDSTECRDAVAQALLDPLNWEVRHHTIMRDGMATTFSKWINHYL